ncbi:winged helix-turn-helix domain-containing protein [Enterobacter asburiae]|uniref:winged helix-turn-helix domain-containing protein n=1 Tax=Enterobacter asburiae TaxID=61645 RepID=UPI0018EBBE20|nr:winged helix-turn-helix domain-containing protein [Enterobacter asburiae]MBJ6588697.1 winged helix-turn-helix domain-containing protein [Enterobacter asburiae]
MVYLIDGVVIYDALNGTLRRTSEKVVDAVNLTTIANKILWHLLLHHGELVTRDTLFDEIWEKEGIVSSSNTLTQYISLLRKTFSRYLGNKEVIVTVPRSGYYFSKDITVTGNAGNTRWRPQLKLVVTVFVILSMMFSGMFFFTSRPTTVNPRKIGELKGCPVYDISGVKSDVADASSFEVARKALEMNNQICTETTAFYIYAQEALHLHKPARIMFSRCIEWHDERDTCQNIYYYTWIR